MKVGLANAALMIITLKSLHGISASVTKERRVLRPNDNVGALIRQSHNYRLGRGRDGHARNRYTIHSEIDSGLENTGAEIAMDVVEAVIPAVTIDTIIKDDRGNEFTVENSEDILLYTLLVTDVETADGADTFAMLAINPVNDDMHGFVEKRGRHGKRVPYTINQSQDETNGIAVAHELVDLPEPDWHCDVKEGTEEESYERNLMEIHVSNDLIDKIDVQTPTLIEPPFDVQLKHHFNHDEEATYASLTAIESLNKSVRGMKANPLNKPMLLQSTSYNFQVDMYIEIDNAFISKLGGLNNAINYVNTLVTGANVIYEKEIDTHLRVTNIIVSSLYDNAKSSSEALK